MIIYCLKCKHKTETIDQMEVQSKNGRDDQGKLFNLWYKKVCFYIFVKRHKKGNQKTAKEHQREWFQFE